MWLLTALASWELYWTIDQGVAGGGSWPTIVWALVPAVMLAAVSLAMLPKNVAIVPASLSSPESSGGESLLLPPGTRFPWKTPLLWAVLVAAAGLLGWMAHRLSKDLAKS